MGTIAYHGIHYTRPPRRFTLISHTLCLSVCINSCLVFDLSCSEPFIIFSGGLSYDKASRRPSLTIMHGKAITVLEMDHPIVDFLTLCETPYSNGKRGEMVLL